MRLPDAPRSRAVLIGAGHYQDEKLHDLPGALGNVTDLAAHLMHEQWGAFGSGSCTTIVDPTNVSQVGESLAETAEQAEDTLLVYYAGHGLLDARGELFLGLSTTNSARVAYTAMPFGFIQRAFLDSPATSRILILDCCFSGRAIEAMTDPSSVVSGQIEISGVYTLTSAPANQPANAPGGERHTAFTGELLRLLHHGVPAGDELITLGQIYTHLLTALNARGLPKPQRRGTGTSDRLALARNPAWVTRERPAGQRPGLPGDVVELLDNPLPAMRRDAIARLAHLIRTRHPVYAQPAFTALVHLSDDDSRMVGATAKSTLLELEHEKVSEGRAESVPAPATRTQGRTRLSAGISFGTTNSAIAVLDNGRPVIVPSSGGTPTIPSIVAFAKNGEVLVGQPAKDQAVPNRERTVRSVKRHLGTGWTIKIDGKTYTAQEISARVLMKLKRDAESYLREDIRDVVITVPAYFDDAQRQATKEAGQIAGLNVLRIVNEPTAAALAYGLDKGEKEQTILVFDLGGGTFDVSLLEIGDGVVEVRATSGDTRLGGDDWDQRIVDWLVDRVKATTGTDPNRDRLAMARVREAAEQAKIELSSSTSANVNLPHLTVDADRNPVQLDEVLTRAEFERITSDLLDRTRGPVNNVIKDAGIKIGDIDNVILVGGSTRMPAVSTSLQDWLGTAHHGIRLIKFTDEAVAMGAALAAGVLTGEVLDVLSLDVTPMSLGIETKGGVFTKLIERNTSIPAKRSEIFSTADDGQTTVGIQVFQGEREIAVHNKKLGTFDLTGISPAPRGVPQIQVTFDIDANGIVHVSAKDLGTSKEQSMTITGGSALPKDDIDRMVKDAEAHAEEDKARRDEAETRNQAETLVYQTEKFVKENDEKIPADAKEKVTAAIKEANEALAGTDVAKIKSAMETLATESQAMGSAIYAQTGASAAGAGGGGGAGPTGDSGAGGAEDVVDAEIVEEEGKK